MESKEVAEKIVEGLEEEEIKENTPGYLDKMFSKVISRRFLVFLIGTLFVLFCGMSYDHWMVLVGLFLGTKVANNFIKGMVEIIAKKGES